MTAYELKAKYKGQALQPKLLNTPKSVSCTMCLNWELTDNALLCSYEYVNAWGKVYWIDFGIEFDENFIITKVHPVIVQLYGGETVKTTNVSPYPRKEEHYKLVDKVLNMLVVKAE